jgi:hypothetical protein
MSARSLALLALAPCFIAACGASEADEKDVRRAVESLYDSVAAKDEKKVCRLLSKQGREELVRRSGPGGGPASCETVVGLTLTFGGRGVRDARSAKVTDVDVNDDKAKATVEYRRQSGDVGLVKEGGEWKLNGLALN